MTDIPHPQTRKRVTLDDRKALLKQLKLPAGQATIERASGGDRDQLVVRLSPGARPATSPRRFRGRLVRYERLLAGRTW